MPKKNNDVAISEEEKIKKEEAKRKARMNKLIKEKNIKIFEETDWLCHNDDEIENAIKNTKDKTIIAREEDSLPAGSLLYSSPSKVLVTNSRSLEAAEKYKDKKVCVLNFASFCNPGGGVKRGEKTQEEALCRGSSLFWSIATPDCMNQFYIPHRTMTDARYNDDMIYSPEVLVIRKDDDSMELLEHEDRYFVDIITCAAPNLGRKASNQYNTMAGATQVKLSDEELLELLEKRYNRLFELAHSQGAEILILGAIGTGVFHNKASVVAEAFRNVILRHPNWFETIEFAIPGDPNDKKFRDFSILAN